MKIPRWFTRNYLLSHLRIASAVTLMSAAAAMAFVAANDSSLFFSSQSQPKRQALNKSTSHTVAGNRGEPGAAEAAKGEDPDAAAEEAYSARAYPATEIPFSATLNAQKAWAKIKSQKNKNTVGTWTLAGPSTANYPGTLSFTGADYAASGRVTGLAIDPNCTVGKCRVWVAAAGGGVWRTSNALAGSGATWTFQSGSFGTNAIGTLIYDNGVLYAGTGESHASGDSEAGLGIWKSTDGGDTWTHLASQVTNLTTSSCGASFASGACALFVDNGTYTGDAFAGRSISSIVVDPNNANVLYVSSTRGVRGVSSVTGGATTNPTPPRPPFGLFKSTDGGATFTFIWDGNDSVRGVNRVQLDPSNNTIVYAAAYQQGVWRSSDDFAGCNAGPCTANTAQIKTPLVQNENTDRAEFAVTKLGNGNTRMYVGDGSTGPPGPANGFNPLAQAAKFYRSDDVATGTPAFTDLTTTQNSDYCSGQCWYDNVVYSPPGKPDAVYVGGSYSYGTYGFTTNGRAFIRSTDAGASFTDQTYDATTNPPPPGSYASIYPGNAVAPNGQHPDSHAVVEVPGTDAAIFGTDGGLMRSSGAFTDISSQCTTDRGLSGSNLTLCQQLLSSVPTYLYNMNKSLSTLQFQSLSVAADNPKHVQGGTQDNGTFETYGSSVTWPQIIYGDGGQSGFSATNSSMRFNSFFGQNHDANFQNGDPTKWVIISGPIVSSPEGSNFYAPIIADPNPANAGTIFEGSQSVWRTQDWGGNQATLEANCPEFTTPSSTPTCGDFVRIGPAGATDLTAAGYGTRAGGFVAAIERVPSDTGTLWVATTTGRVFISKNADAAAAGSVTYTRLDTLPSATTDPNRFVSGIYVDPANPNHAWISYSGYNFNTPSQTGHVFEVTYNQGTNDATWTKLDGSGATAFPDFPATDIVRDSNGDLYASNDFGVMRLANGSTDWVAAGTGLPMVEVAGLTIVPSARKLYAATHGRSAWQLSLP
jgi:hypothetical protein